MEITRMTFCRIHDPSSKKVLVLDKVKKVGWEGLTFPGGKVEGMESFLESCVREVREETGLEVSQLKFCGVLQWVSPSSTHGELVALYDTCCFKGEKVDQTDEGKVFWMDEETFLKTDGKADYFDAYYRVIVDDDVSEALCIYREDSPAEIRYF